MSQPDQADHFKRADTEYFRKRYEQENAFAERATRPEAKSVHARLADEYARRLADDPPR